MVASVYFQPSVVLSLVAGKAFALVDFLNQIRGLVPAVVLTPLPSVIVADTVRKELHRVGLDKVV